MSEQLILFFDYLAKNAQIMSIADYADVLQKEKPSEWIFWLSAGVLIIVILGFLISVMTEGSKDDCLTDLFSTLGKCSAATLFSLVIIALSDNYYYYPKEIQEVAKVRCATEVCEKIEKRAVTEWQVNAYKQYEFLKQKSEIKKITNAFLEKENLSALEKIAINQCEAMAIDVNLFKDCVMGKLENQVNKAEDK